MESPCRSSPPPQVSRELTGGLLPACALGLALWSGSAAAAPAGYDTAGCNPGGVDVCQYDTTLERWDCDLSSIGDSGATEAWMVFGDSSARSSDCSNICDGNLYCAWGQQGSTKFFCVLPETGGEYMVEGRLMGTTQTDQLSFWYEESSLKCGMMNHHLHSIPLVTGRMMGRSGADKMHGSWVADDDYLDVLLGGAGNDAMYTHEGADEAYGGPDDDTIHGGDAFDLIEGGDGDDHIHSGDGDDIVHGGTGDDVVCGGYNDDELHGQADHDILWGGDRGSSGSEPGDVAYGGAGVDLCNAPGGEYLCAPLSSPPTTCPADVLPY